MDKLINMINFSGFISVNDKRTLYSKKNSNFIKKNNLLYGDAFIKKSHPLHFGESVIMRPKRNLTGRMLEQLSAKVEKLSSLIDKLSSPQRQELIDMICLVADEKAKLINKNTSVLKNKIGIPEVEFPRNFEASNLFKESISDIHKAGIDLSGLKSIKPFSSESDYSAQWGKFTLDADNKPMLQYNESFNWKKDNLIKLVTVDNTSDYLFCDNPKSLVYHLVGHFLHFRTNQECFAKDYENRFEKFKLEDVEYFRNLSSTEQKRLRELIKTHVDIHSSKKEKDVPAGIFVGLMNGKSFPEEIIKLYKAMEMPMPKKYSRK